MEIDPVKDRAGDLRVVFLNLPQRTVRSVSFLVERLFIVHNLTESVRL